MAQLIPCIYCSCPFDPSQGEGDHVIPARLGEFRNGLKFRGLCQRCNNIIGKSEEQLLRCGPERLYRDVVIPATARSRGKRSSWSTGANGMPPPRLFINTPHGKVMGHIGSDLKHPEIIDQLSICTEDGQEYFIKIFPKMPAEELKRKVRKIVELHGASGRIDVRCTCNKEKLDTYQKLINEVFLDSENKSLPLEPGEHPVEGRIDFKFSDHYFRALAKIAFHYYLATFKRVNGSEAEFGPIRNFIINGGNIQEFFVDQKRFVRPRLPPGMAPSRWGHILSVHEFDVVTGYVALFVGPAGRQVDYHVRIGRVASRLYLPDLVWSHAYVYDENPSVTGKVGEVYPNNPSTL